MGILLYGTLLMVAVGVVVLAVGAIGLWWMDRNPSQRKREEEE